jgi:hypothetical protein
MQPELQKLEPFFHTMQSAFGRNHPLRQRRNSLGVRSHQAREREEVVSQQHGADTLAQLCAVLQRAKEVFDIAFGHRHMAIISNIRAAQPRHDYTGAAPV